MVKYKRKISEKQFLKDKGLLPQIQEIKSLHPFWGCRRIWAYLKFKDGININHKRVARLLKLHNLGVCRKTLKAKRTPQGKKPRAKRPCQWWGIDMTKIMTDSGWVYVTLVLDWYSKVIVGYHVGYQSRAKHWLEALDMAVQNNFPYGARKQNLSLMSDNGCQPTSISFMKECSTLGIHQTFTSYNNPKGNADTERMMRTLKEELLWLQEWQSLGEIESVFLNWVNYYNNEYLHSTLGWNTPQSVHENHLNVKKEILLNVA